MTKKIIQFAKSFFRKEYLFISFGMTILFYIFLSLSDSAKELSKHQISYSFSLRFLVNSIEDRFETRSIASDFLDIGRLMLTFTLPSICALHIIRITIIEERHIGWKRLATVSLVLIVLMVILGTELNLTNIATFSYWVLVISPMALLPIMVIRWVVAGFSNKAS